MNQNTNKENKFSGEIIYKAKRHWSYGLIAKIWGVLIILSILMFHFTMLSIYERLNDTSISFRLCLFWLIPHLILLLPTIITLLKQKNFQLYITKQNVVYVDGAFTKKIRSIAISHINDVMVEENFIFKDSGRLYLMTGNENAKAIKGVENPGYFRDKLLETMNAQ